jgi:signal transduction histidine kinase
MKQRTTGKLVWGALACIVLAVLGGSVLAWQEGKGIDIFELTMLSFPIVGALVAGRQPDNVIGRIMLGIGAGEALSVVLTVYAFYGLDINPGSLPHPDIALGFESGLWVPFVGLVGTFLLLLFPDGHLPSPRWRLWAWFSAVVMILVYTIITIAPGSLRDSGYSHIRNPLGIEALRPIIGPAFSMVALIPVAIVGCAVALIRRFRQSHGQERLQLKWFTAAAALLAVSYLILMALNLPYLFNNEPTPHWIDIVGSVGIFSFALIPIAVGIAIFKYRLYEINVVINKALVFGSLAAFITAVYVGIVVGVGTLVGSGDRPNLALSIAATAIVAIAFQPVRERVQGIANRLVYGERATPYEVLTRFSKSLGALVSIEDVLPQIARQTAEGIGAELVTVTSYLEQGQRAASYPPGLHASDKPSTVVPVMYKNEPVGEIRVVKPESESVTSQERRLLAQLGVHAGVVLHNYRLAVELRARLEQLSKQSDDLKDSRERLVAAADTSRRTIEGAIRGEVEGKLVAIASDLDTTESMIDSDPQAASDLLETLSIRTNETLEALRDLARGIYPPLLVDKGLIVALEAHIRKMGLDVDLEVGEQLIDARFARSVETSCYFCLRETLDNIARHAAGAPAGVILQLEKGRLVFKVRDEGPGFDVGRLRSEGGLQAMKDRVAASGGELQIESKPGEGTTVGGWIPLQSDDFPDTGDYPPVAVAQASSS